MAEESGSRGLFGRRKRSGTDEQPSEMPASEGADEASIAAAAEREAMARLAEAEQRAEGIGGPSVADPPPAQGAAEGAEELRRRLGERIDTARGVVPPAPIEAEPPRPIEDPPRPPSAGGPPAPTPEFVASAEHEAASEPGGLTDALADEIAADLGAVGSEPGSGGAAQLERAENVIAAREARFEAALARARDRLDAAEGRASEAEQRAQRAEELTAFQERERRQAEELRAVLDRISEAEERARRADERISELIEATAAPPELESLLSGGEGEAPVLADPGAPGEDDVPGAPAPPLALAPEPEPETVPGLAATESAETDPATSPPVEPGVPEPPVHLSAAPEPPSETAVVEAVEPAAPTEPDPEPDPRIDLNEASSQDLRALGTPVIGIGRILAERERRGGFGSVDDLDAVKGLDPELLARLKSAMRVGEAPGA